MNIRRIAMMMLFVGAFAMTLSGCATQRGGLTDQGIAEAIKSDLEAQSGPEGPFGINVLVQRGEVTLDGEVSSNRAKEEAMGIAQRMEGVRDVKSFLVITE